MKAAQGRRRVAEGTYNDYVLALVCLSASIDEEWNAVTESDGLDLIELKDIMEWLPRRLRDTSNQSCKADACAT